MSYNEPPNYGTPPPPPGGAYGAPQPGYGGGPLPKSVLAIVGLVLGIIGVIPCFWGCFVPSIAGLVLGFLGQKEIKAGKKTGAGLATGAIVTGAIGILLSIVAVILIATDVIDFNTYSDM